MTRLLRAPNTDAKLLPRVLFLQRRRRVSLFSCNIRLLQRRRCDILERAYRSCEGAMQAFLLIMLVQVLILVAVWRWDQHTRRQQRHRRHLEILQARSNRRAT